MPTSYNGRGPTLRERIDAFIKARNAAPAYSEAPFPAVYEGNLPQARWSPRTAEAYFKEGYRINSAVYSVTRTLANAFAEAPLRVYSDVDKKKPLPDHPLQLLIKQPNSYMGEDELWKFWITYAANGGNAYARIVPTNGGLPGEIWPYNDIVMWPVPVGKRWVDHYRYSLNNGISGEDIPPEEVVQYKWSVDPEQPWRGMPALAPVAREVDSDNELTRYLKALLQNDAVPRTILKVKDYLPSPELDRVRNEWNLRYGNKNVGGVGILQGGTDIERMSLNMQELAFDALRGVPEARIAAAYGVPAIVAGLNIGLARSTYSNFEEARKMFTEQTLVPLWASVASEFQHSLANLYPDAPYLEFDLTSVRALQDDTSKRLQWIVEGYKAGIVTQNEARTEYGLEPIEGGDEPYTAPAPVINVPNQQQPDQQQPDNGAEKPSAGQGDQPAAEGAQNGPQGSKAAYTDSKEVGKLEAIVAKQVHDYLAAQYDAIAGHVGK